MKKTGRKKPKRSRPVHGRQSKKRLEQEVKATYGRQSAEAAENDDRDWQAWEAPPPSKPSTDSGTDSDTKSDTSTTPADADSNNTLDEVATAGSTHQGLVVGLASGLCWAEVDGELHQAILPSRLARQQRSHLAVGDQVLLAEVDDDRWRVEEILPRRSELSRPDPHNPRRQRLIAANIDLVVVLASVVAPPLRPALIDRYLITVDRGGAEALIIVNKTDLLLDAEHRREALAPLRPYTDLGLSILPCSTVTGEGVEAIRQQLKDRLSVVVGHSGVGKSSLLNALDERVDLSIGAVSDGGSGRHTTTRSGLYRLRGGIRIIDTPGIRELGLGSLDAQELRLYFPEFDEPSRECRFNNCSHQHEPDCGVRVALRDGNIDRGRFATYERMLASLAEDEGQR